MSSHMHMGHDMPSPQNLQKAYWAVVGSFVGAAALANLINRLLAFQRLRDTSLTPSKPKSLFFRFYATLTALAREASHAVPPPVSISRHRLYFAPLGPLAIVLANLVTVLILCFYKLDTENQWAWEDVGYRTGFVTIAQLPLLFLLSGRRNIIGILSGTDYARLNWYHRWIARTFWLCATLHMGFWFRSWGRYNYITYQLKNEYYAKRGFAAWCILTFIVVSSARPLRRLGYEFFVLQHLVMFVGFIVAVWMHVKEEDKVWVWISVGLLIFDRVLRYVWGAYVNLGVFHPASRALWKHQASFTSLPGDVTRVTIRDPGLRWAQGQHMFLTCHAIVPLQSHPFTISSIPEDKQIEFLIRSQKGGTRRFYKYAENNTVLGTDTGKSCTVLLEGPYGVLRPLYQFDTVVLIAGGMGATFTMPLLRDLVRRWKNDSGSKDLSLQRVQSAQLGKAVVRRVRFVWVVRSRKHLAWFETQLLTVLADVNVLRRASADTLTDIKVSIHVTDDMELAILGHGSSTSDTEPASTNSLEKSAVTDEDTLAIQPLPSANNASPLEHQQQHQSSPQPARLPALTPQHGRPQVHPLIRTALEEATGESAVVVCGPPSLADDTRRSVVSLSDERAVHKGTGAQGVYLHVENFGS
ncbi:ferric reductase family protein [Aspergillus mulundensis]|uniref:ferric-chelate reductase (NADPH) n=1 Tax=Aspergillus mulundensis TaxID=1810919 RepID=A0A3D8RF39_9EURO|nr:Metalloreductase [Aspergillus mulundensis]RDW72580.1 Metalloreductase [Aspergillus mulundensis]